jgi:hypothetical protein
VLTEKLVVFSQDPADRDNLYYIDFTTHKILNLKDRVNGVKLPKEDYFKAFMIFPNHFSLVYNKVFLDINRVNG